MYCLVYGCNSDSKTTSEVRFFYLQAVNHLTSNTEKRLGLNSASEKHLNHHQTLEYAHFISLKTPLSQDSRHSF